jgi:hypothetical protein
MFEFYFRDDSNEEINDFISFDWANESTTDRILKLNDGKLAHFVVCFILGRLFLFFILLI